MTSAAPHIFCGAELNNQALHNDSMSSWASVTEKPVDYDELRFHCMSTWAKMDTSKCTPAHAYVNDKKLVVPRPMFICKLLELSAGWRAVRRRLAWAEDCRRAAPELKRQSGPDGYETITILNDSYAGVGDAISPEDEHDLITEDQNYEFQLSQLLCFTELSARNMQYLLLRDAGVTRK